MTATPHYPLFDAPVAGRIHIRGYDSGLEASRIGDIAAIALELAAAGHHVSVLAEHTPKTVEVVGEGWNPPNIRFQSARTLVEATMHLYEASRSIEPEQPHALLIENFTSLRTGAGRGHDDLVAAKWLNAAAAGDHEQLFELTGLSLHRYLGDDTATLAATGIVAGVQLRRGDGPAGQRIMGGNALLTAAETVTVVGIDTTAAAPGGCVAGAATVLKHQNLAVVGEHRITRPVGDVRHHPWSAARTAA